MKNYKFLVPILLVALLGGSVYKTYSDREKINKQYDNDITQARQNRKKPKERLKRKQKKTEQQCLVKM